MIHKAHPCLVSFPGWPENEANPCHALAALAIPQGVLRHTLCIYIAPVLYSNILTTVLLPTGGI